jgi:hypothetical protein
VTNFDPVELTPASDGDSVSTDEVGTKKPVDWWEAEGVPDTASSSSLYYVGDDGAKHFQPPTHYLHLADGRVVAGYSGGTHYTEPGKKKGDPDRTLRIIGTHEG